MDLLKLLAYQKSRRPKFALLVLIQFNLLKVASSSLGFGPQLAMQLAERLYTQGFISYPRTESTAYPSSFDFRGALEVLRNNSVSGNDVQKLLADGYIKPRSGTDVGDHPPITPMRSALEDMLGYDAWRVYQYVCQHFLGTLSPDCKFIRTKIDFLVGVEFFNCTGQNVTVKGFTSLMPWLAVSEKSLHRLTKGEKIELSKVELYEGYTAPPDYLSESELISLMEKNGIGTDASIPVHINNISERNYVQVQAGRRPSQPFSCCATFQQKFSYFVKKIENMDSLFEAQFSPLSDGKCPRYMKYISSLPSRLFCGTCEEVYFVPQKGTIKLYKEIMCPLERTTLSF
ncbi:DNA topoisomerase [Heracleum sosnowskyi]|uniref:DNA topoisomerase n=1 Tax=Heracleum sosnowskyi TaxID=360622 RepID=A0AAD8MMP9_9APIA|nr:DNA topoisomerase [Heracleum sosnowskyi]